MTRRCLCRLSAGGAALALALAVLTLSACGENLPGATSTSETQTPPTTAGRSTPITAPTTTAPALPATVRDESWNLEFTIELAVPDTYSFGGFGNLLLHIDGDKVRATGVITIGDSTYSEFVFDGVLDGGLFTLLTTEFPVEPGYGDDVGTEGVTLVLPPFAFTGDTARATGGLVIVTKPWAPTKSGTFTIVLCRGTQNR